MADGAQQPRVTAGDGLGRELGDRRPPQPLAVPGRGRAPTRSPRRRSPASDRRSARRRRSRGGPGSRSGSARSRRRACPTASASTITSAKDSLRLGRQSTSADRITSMTASDVALAAAERRKRTRSDDPELGDERLIRSFSGGPRPCIVSSHLRLQRRRPHQGLRVLAGLKLSDEGDPLAASPRCREHRPRRRAGSGC